MYVTTIVSNIKRYINIVYYFYLPVIRWSSIRSWLSSGYWRHIYVVRLSPVLVNTPVCLDGVRSPLCNLMSPLLSSNSLHTGNCCGIIYCAICDISSRLEAKCVRHLIQSLFQMARRKITAVSDENNFVDNIKMQLTPN